jgi:hypothetical protein
MPTSSEIRRAELRALRRTDPVLLLALYRRAARLDPDAAIPPGQTFATMITAVLDAEEIHAARPVAAS